MTKSRNVTKKSKPKSRNIAKRGRPRKSQDPRPLGAEIERELAEWHTQLMEHGKVENEIARRAYVNTVVDAEYHLRDLALRRNDGTITTDDRKTVAPLRSKQDQALRVLGLDAHKKKESKL